MPTSGFHGIPAAARFLGRTFVSQGVAAVGNCPDVLVCSGHGLRPQEQKAADWGLKAQELVCPRPQGCEFKIGLSEVSVLAGCSAYCMPAWSLLQARTPLLSSPPPRTQALLG